MATITKQEYVRHCQEHLADFRSFLEALPDDRWDEPSLCEGWRVRDVVGHLTIGRTIPVTRVLMKVAAGGFNVDKVVDRASRDFGGSHSPSEMRTIFNAETSRPKERGLAGVEPPKAKLGDNVTHMLDITVPLGLPVDLPEARLVATLEALTEVGMWKSKQRTKGLRLVAEDVAWSHGDGPEVRGTAAALILTLGGRAQMLDELTGDGVEILRERLAS